MTTTVQRLSQLNFASLSPAGGLFPSPITWEDQAFYFLMLDRFSDGRENGYKDNEGNLVRSGTTPAYSPAGAENAVKTEADAARWREAGVKYVGGTLKGLESKIGYLKRLGVTALWISPIFKQVRFRETYHSYGTGVRTAIEQSTTYGGTKNV
jgi:glycosidase